MIPRTLLTGLLAIALLGLPGASAGIAENPVVPNPCDTVNCDPDVDVCPDINTKAACDTDTFVAIVQKVAEEAERIIDQLCPEGTGQACGHEDTIQDRIDQACPGGTSQACGHEDTIQDRIDQACPDGVAQACGADDEVQDLIDQACPGGTGQGCGVEDTYAELADSLCRNSFARDTIQSTGHARCEYRQYQYRYELVIDPDVPTVNELLGLVPTQDEVEDAVAGAEDTARSTVRQHAPDADGDDVPDVLEQAVCGPAIVRNNLNASGYLYCVDQADLYVEPAGTFTDMANATVDAVVLLVEATAAWVLSEVDELRGQVDADRDGVADEAEPWVCQVENPNFDEDGACDPTLTDYTPPA